MPVPQMLSVRRVRANTIDSGRSLRSPIYDEDYTKYIHECLRPGEHLTSPWTLPAPRLPDNPNDWTEKAIANAYFYAQYRLKSRTVTPRTQVFLEQYREVADAAIKEPSYARKSVLTALTKTLNSKVILSREASFNEIRGQVALKNVVFMRYLACYEDYLGAQFRRFRDAAISEGVEDVKLFTGDAKNWTAVHSSLEKEEKAHNAWKRRANIGYGDFMPDDHTTQAIHKACIALELDYENTRYSIKWYSKRNEHMHCNIAIHINDCNWDALGIQLRKDLNDLPKIMGDSDYEQMRLVLTSIAERYFERLDDQHCIPSEKASILRFKRDRKHRERLRNEESKAERLREQQNGAKLAREARSERSYRDIGTQFDGMEVAERRKKKSSSSC